ncbi:MAG TPA: hypothetical protein VEA40_21785 [Ramlibacter sp.]|nr:hypothetical protein [Ramlibacter sp.]
MRALNRSARIAESSTSTGAGDFTVAGAITGCKTFSAACTLYDWFEYLIEAVDTAGMPTGEWEAGIGMYSATNTLTRVMVQGSSLSGGGRISFAAGSKVVSLTRLGNNIDPVLRHLAHGGDTTAVTAATLITWRPRRNLTILEFSASLATASSSGPVTLDIRVNGNSLLTTLLSIPAGSKTSVGGTAAVFADPDLVADDEVTIVCTAAGTGAAGLRVTLNERESPIAHMDGLSLRLSPEDMRPFHTRASAAWAFDANGVLQQYAANVLRVVPSPAGVTSALREPASTNKCLNYNANPNEAAGTVETVGGANTISNVAVNGDASATLSVVDDAAALAAAGLSSVCTSGKVYKLDNSAGAATADATVSGTVGNLNGHTTSVYWRGSGQAKLGLSGGLGTAQALGGSYVRHTDSNRTPAATSNVLMVRAEPGAIVYFILNQLEELPFVTTPIVVAGSAVTRTADNFAQTSAGQALQSGQGGAYMAFQHNGYNSFDGLFQLDDATASNRHIAYLNSSTAVVYRKDVAAAATTLSGGTAVSTAATNKVSIGYGTTAPTLAIGGGAVTTMADATVPAGLTRWSFGIGGGSAGGSYYISEFRLYRTRPNANKQRRMTA